jgi:hypothetical protein
MKKLLKAFCFINAVLASVPASAAIVTLNYDVIASQFFTLSPNGGTPPYDPVTVSYSVTFDNSSDINSSTAGLNILNLSIPSPNAGNFSYSSAQDLLTIGSNTSPGSVTFGPGDYGFGVSGASSLQYHNFFVYNDAVTNNSYFTPTLVATSRAAGPGAPAPEIGMGLLSALAAGLALFVSRIRMPAFPFARRRRLAAA